MKARCSGSLAARKSAVGVSRIRSLYAIVTTLLLLQLYACQGFTRTVLTNYNRCNKIGNTYYRDGSLVTYSTSSDSSNNEQPKKRRVLPFRFKNNKQGNINGVNSSNNNNGNNKRRFPNPIKKFTTFLKSLSRTRRILFLQSLFIFALFSSSAVVSSIRTPIGSAKRPIEVSYSKFLKIVENQDKVGTFIDQDVRIPYLYDLKIGDRISYKLAKDAPTEAPPVVVPKKRFQFKRATTTSPLFVYTRAVRASPELVSTLREQKLDFSAAPVPKASALAVTIRTVMLGFYFVILFRLYKSISKGAGGGSGDVPGKLAQKSGDLPLASFEDIQGIDVAKNEVMELVDTLRNPQKYAILGARAPTGLLLEGPPGTGKTMLARATAASAGVPLLYCSGSDFVEMFVGRGAARVRKLFERASKLSPCIIFIDELDALGKARDSGNSFGGGAFGRSNDEAEQTLNQLLACMDGLDSSRRICVLAATNRREVLDPALVRPGRFDRIVALKLPDIKGRENILRVHTSKLPGFNEGTGIANDRPNALGIGRQVDLSAVAAATEGLSGAELEFVVNEAAIRAVRRVSAALRKDNVNTDTITPHVEAKDFEEAVATFYSTRKGRQQPPWRTVFKQ